MLTKLQEEQIRQLRTQGAGYRQIAKDLNLSCDEVRYYCKKQNINGFPAAVQANMQMMREAGDLCRNCGSFLKQPHTGRKRHFCNEECRRQWWNKNRDKIRESPAAIYGFTCKRCGKEFTAYGNSRRQYCSHECYISDRFWDGEQPTKSTEMDLANVVPTIRMIS